MNAPVNPEDASWQSELDKRLFPGGDAERELRGMAVSEISNRKLLLPEALRVYAQAKAREWMAKVQFDGKRRLGPKAAWLIERTQRDAEGKLNPHEAAAVVYYALCYNVDTSGHAAEKVQTLLEVVFGSDDWPSEPELFRAGSGEFGFDPTSPIPVRGVASNRI